MPPINSSVHRYPEGVKCTMAKKTKLKGLEGKNCHIIFKQNEGVHRKILEIVSEFSNVTVSMINN